jgi:hypothetical protein
LIGAALVSALASAVGFWRLVWGDSGSFAVVLFGVPVACAAVALWAERATASRLAPAVVTVTAAVSLVWTLLTAGGIGAVFLLPSALLLGAATVSWLDRQRPDDAPPIRT